MGSFFLCAISVHFRHWILEYLSIFLVSQGSVTVFTTPRWPPLIVRHCAILLKLFWLVFNPKWSRRFPKTPLSGCTNFTPQYLPHYLSRRQTINTAINRRALCVSFQLLVLWASRRCLQTFCTDNDCSFDPKCPSLQFWRQDIHYYRKNWQCYAPSPDVYTEANCF